MDTFGEIRAALFYETASCNFRARNHHRWTGRKFFKIRNNSDNLASFHFDALPSPPSNREIYRQILLSVNKFIYFFKRNSIRRVFSIRSLVYKELARIINVYRNCKIIPILFFKGKDRINDLLKLIRVFFSLKSVKPRETCGWLISRLSQMQTRT